MSSFSQSRKAENVCVYTERALIHTTTTPSKIRDSGLFASLMSRGASDEKQYPGQKKLSCAVCSPVKPSSIHTRWGSRKCSSSGRARKLYAGFMAAARPDFLQGGGANYLCMHPTPTHAGDILNKDAYVNACVV